METSTLLGSLGLELGNSARGPPPLSTVPFLSVGPALQCDRR